MEKNKKIARALMLEKRGAMSKEEVLLRSHQVCNQLLTIPFPQLMTMAVYHAIRNEVNIMPYIKSLHAKQFPLCLPIVTRPEKMLRFLKWAPGALMKKSEFGTQVPMVEQEMIPQAILVPLVAFDRGGGRIGYGGGHYDVTLEQMRRLNKGLLTIGVAYDFQQMDEVPREAHDQLLDMVVTESEAVICR